MGRDVVMSLLESIVLLDVMQVISSQDHSSSHFGREDYTLQDSSSDAHVRGEWALLVNISSLNGSLRSFEAKPNFLVISWEDSLLLGKDLL